MSSRFYVVAVALFMFALPPDPAGAAPSDQQIIRDLEEAYARALVNQDIEFLKSYFSSDWVGGDWLGFANKTTVINLIKTGAYRTKSMRVHDIRVRVIGNVAIAQGLEDEVSVMSGRDAAGRWSWLDIFEKRNGHWVVTASQSTRLEPRPKG